MIFCYMYWKFQVIFWCHLSLYLSIRFLLDAYLLPYILEEEFPDSISLHFFMQFTSRLLFLSKTVNCILNTLVKDLLFFIFGKNIFFVPEI